MAADDRAGLTPARLADDAAGRRRRRLLAAASGVLAAAASLAAAEVAVALVGPSSSPVVAVGNAVISAAPPAVKNFAVNTFGAHDKTALITGTLVLLVIFAAAVGLVALRSPTLGALGIVLFGGLGALAAATRPAAGQYDALPSLLGAAVGVVVLRLLVRRLPVDVPAGERDGMDRRRFVIAAGLTLAGALVAETGGRLLQRRFD